MTTKLVIYTQPGCINCDTLKEWLKNKKIDFEEKLFDTEVQVEMVMMNLFDDPPYLGVNDKLIPSGELFDSDGSVIDSVILGGMNK